MHDSTGRRLDASGRRVFHFGIGYGQPDPAFDRADADRVAGEPPGPPLAIDVHGSTMIVDSRDAWLANVALHVQNGYACRTVTNERHVYVHHLLLPRHPTLDVDHANGNRLDNRRSNLRYLTHSENVRLGLARKRARGAEASA